MSEKMTLGGLAESREMKQLSANILMIIIALIGLGIGVYYWFRKKKDAAKARKVEE